MAEILVGKPLCKLSTFGIGGPAKYFLEAASIDDIKKGFQFAKKEGLPVLVLGKGSNCLFDDKGFNGLIILNKISFCEFVEPDLVYAGAGYSFSLLGIKSAKKGLTGLEFACGIPGSVGGAVFMNAGANGWETKDSLEQVEFVTEKGELAVYRSSELHFCYRSSCFHGMRGAIVSASFRLKTCEIARNRQLEILSKRKATQPLSEKSAGCIFRNPAKSHAGSLIEECGLKGTRIGGAEISRQHANFIINKGGATANDVMQLITHVCNSIQDQRGIDLHWEIKYIPYEVT